MVQELKHCPYFSSCGGCTINPATNVQESLKKKIKPLEKICIQQSVPLHTAFYSAPYGWRRRALFRLRYENRQVRIGFFAHHSHHKLVDIRNCLMIHDMLNQLLHCIHEQNWTFLGNERYRLLAQVDHNNQIHIYLEPAQKSSKGLHDLSKQLRSLPDVAQVLTPHHQPATHDHFLVDQQFGIRFYSNPQSFVQAHKTANQALRDAIIKLVGDNHDLGSKILDLYAGTGSLSLACAHKGYDVTAVESALASVKAAQYNIEQNQLALYEVINSNVEQFVQQSLLNHYDLILMDPPRQGASHVLNLLAKKFQGSIIYLSCSPENLLKDWPDISKAFSINHVCVYDFFPYTPYFETLLFLTPRKH